MDREERNKKFEEYLHATPAERRKFDLSFLNEPSLPEGLNEELKQAAEISFDEAYALTEDYRDFLAKGLTENRPRPIGPHWFCEYAKNRFIAGAKWKENKTDQLPNDLNGAAIDFADNARKELFAKDYAISSIADYDHGCIDGFIAGAKWQKQHDAELIEIAYNDGITIGMTKQKEQMLKEAEECELYWDGYFLAIDLNMTALGYSEHDKVRVIVCKKED